MSFLLVKTAVGQDFEVAVFTQKNDVIPQKNSNQNKWDSTDPLSLPFWDDFSQSKVSPNTLLWKDSDDVAISPTTGINNISLNAAVFNGIKATGAAHSTVQFQNGNTDILTSHRIDLSAYSASDNLSLSFFYEKKGNGELPNDEDGIRVEFINKDSLWVTNIWQIKGEEVAKTDRFYQVLIPIVDTQFFNDNFRFRFVATGRQTGLFDTWLIDYVYLHENNSNTPTAYPDRTFTKPLSSTFKPYFAVPINHFVTNPTSFLDFVGAQFINLGGGVQTDFIYNLNAEIMYIDENKDTVLVAPQQLASANDNNVDFNAVNPYIHRDFEVENLLDVSALPATAKYAEFRYELTGIKWDGISSQFGDIDFRINNVVRDTFYLDNYYAYDDGTAERGAGVNNTSSQIAYKFAIPIEDEISAIDIYFPKTIQNAQFGKQVKLKIWSDANDFPANELLAKDIVIEKVDILNQYYRYELNQKIAVSGTFYIGWQQLAQARIFVGLDKNTNSSDRIYFNITGDWEQNDKDITGSLMLRPVFGEIENNNAVTAIDENLLESSIQLYPNPSSGIFHIRGDYDQIDILTINGRKVNPKIAKVGTHTQVNLYGFPSGIYIVRLRKGNYIIHKKTILNQ